MFRPLLLLPLLAPTPAPGPAAGNPLAPDPWVGKPLAGDPAAWNPGGEDLSSQLERLASPSAEERLAAQRWLSVHLARGDFPRVAEAARDGGLEVRRRLAQALAADDRHLGLAVLLATDRQAEVSGVGERAIAQLIGVWSSSARDHPRREGTLPDPWTEDWPQPLSLDPDAGGPARVFDRLGRLGAGPAPLVLDPSLDGGVRRSNPARPPSRGPLVGPWTRILKDLVDAHRLTFEVLGHRGQEELEAGRARAWVRVCKRGDTGDLDTVGQLARWCRGVVREHDPRWNTACARALGATGWPAALAWLEERWVGGADPAALEGLLAAAARGRIAPALARPDRVRALLALAGKRLAAAGPGAVPFAERLALALGAVGPLGPRGEVLAEVLLEGWGSATSPERWIRLVALEGQGLPHPGAARACRDLLARGGDDSLRLQALRTLAQVGGGEDRTVLASPETLFAQARAEGRLEELTRNLVAARVLAPEGWRGVGNSTAQRLALLGWSLGQGEGGRSLGDLRALVLADDPAATAPTLRSWVGLGRGEALGALLSRARRRFREEPRVTRALEGLALRIGLATPAEEQAALERLLAGDPPPEGARGEWLLDLGVLAAAPGEVGEGARSAIQGALEAGAPTEELLPAVELAVAGLRRARRDGEASEFQSLLRRTAVRTRHPLAKPMVERGWAPPERRPARRLEEADRVLGADHG